MRVPSAVAAIALWGCGGPHGAFQLAWTFADGRRCADASVVRALVAGPVECGSNAGAADPTGGCGFACDLGMGGNAVEVIATGKGTLTVAGQSASGAALYRGETALESLAPATVTLYFAGGG